MSEDKQTKQQERIEKIKAVEEKEAQTFKEWREAASVGLLENECYFETQHYVMMVAKGKTNGVIINGRAGTGKSTLVKTILNNLGVEYAYARSHSSAAAFYVWLYEHRKQVCVIDDVNQLIRDKRGLEYLKAALETEQKRIVGNMTQTPLKNRHGELVPLQFEFTGSIIFLLNKMPKNNPDLNAVVSRVQYVELVVPFEEMLRLIGDLANKDLPQFRNLTKEEKFEVVKFIKDNYHEEVYEQLNLRTFIKISQFRDYAKDSNDNELWIRLATAMLDIGDTRLEIIKKLEADKELTAEQKVEKFIEMNDGKGSRTTYFRLKSQING